ncbi:MAG TPA: hypothetical protein VN915_17665 [Elusimicrobiota bacterium]|nr:hypothetical protein [Elusimicrobiota bacterium]
MAPKVKAAMGALTDALETALSWAFVAVAAYALLFVNMTGNGSLWDSLRGVVLDEPAKAAPTVSVVTRVVPDRPVDAMEKAQNRMLMVPEVPEKEFSVPVVAQNQPARLADQITDAPADAKAGKDWRKHLTGSLRTFTVYGEGEQHSSASASAASGGAISSRPPSVAAAAPTPATASSAYRAGLGAEARPGVSDHIAPEGNVGDGVRNFR